MFFLFSFETWKPIRGYEGLYEVSDFGRVRSLDRHVITKRGVASFYRGQIIKQRTTITCDYLTVDLCKNGKRTHHLTHRLVVTAFFGEIKLGLEVNHKNGNHIDNRIENLETISHLNNIRHAIRTGLTRQNGELSVLSKISNQKAKEIRDRVNQGETQRPVAKNLGLDYRYVNAIVLNKTYKNI